MFAVVDENGKHYIVKEHQEIASKPGGATTAQVEYELARTHQSIIRLNEREFIIPESDTRFFRE